MAYNCTGIHSKVSRSRIMKMKVFLSILSISVTLLGYCIAASIPLVEANGDSTVSLASSNGTYRYRVYDPDTIRKITLYYYDYLGRLIPMGSWSPNAQTYYVGISKYHILLYKHRLDVDDCSYIDSWDIAIINGRPSFAKTASKGGKKQSMSFIAPFNLSALEIPGSVTFDLFPENMTSHQLVLTIPTRLGGGNASLDFLSGYGEIFFNYSEYSPDIVIFDINEWVMTYTEFTISGQSTGLNTAVTDPTSLGSLNITSGQMTVYETGTYTNNVFKAANPINYWIIYSGLANFTSNVIYLEGEGGVNFPGPVGGVLVPVDKFGLLAPYIGLASTILVATAATAVYVKRVKSRKEKQ